MLLAVAAVGAAFLRLALPWQSLSREWWSFTASDDAVVGLPVVGVAVVLLTYVLSNEIRSRRGVARLVGELRRSHRSVETAVQRTLTLRAERQRLAREIHEQLGQTLSQLAVQLEKALQYRLHDAATADAAVRDAKQLGSAALAGVRRSVAVLRVRQTTVDDAAVFEPLRPLNSGKRPRLPFDRLALLPLLWCAAYYMLVVYPVDEAELPAGDKRTILIVVLVLLVVDWLYPFLVRAVRRRFVAPVLIALWSALIVLVSLISNYWFGSMLPPLIPYVAFRYYAPRPALRLSLLLCVATLGFLFVGSRSNPEYTLGGSLVGIVTIAGPFLAILTISYAVVQERAQRVEAERLLAELERTHAAFADASAEAMWTVAERNHLARDIHDGLGHYFTVINVQLEKAIAFRSIEPEVADSALQVARRLVADALHEVRTTFSALSRSAELPSLDEALSQLVDNVGGLPVQLHLDGDAVALSKGAQFALYRVAQEALTNIQRHAAATAVTVELVVQGTEARLRIEDDERGFDPSHFATATGDAGGCFGLNGMRERLEVFGGTLTVDSRVGAGTCLEARVPVSRGNGRDAPVVEAAL